MFDRLCTQTEISEQSPFSYDRQRSTEHLEIPIMIALKVGVVITPQVLEYVSPIVWIVL